MLIQNQVSDAAEVADKCVQIILFWDGNHLKTRSPEHVELIGDLIITAIRSMRPQNFLEAIGEMSQAARREPEKGCGVNVND